MVGFIKKRLFVSTLLFCMGIDIAFAGADGVIDYQLIICSSDASGSAVIKVEMNLTSSAGVTKLVPPTTPSGPLDAPYPIQLLATSSLSTPITQEGDNFFLNAEAGDTFTVTYEVPVSDSIDRKSFYIDMVEGGIAFDSSYLLLIPSDTDGSWDISVSMQLPEGFESNQQPQVFKEISGADFHNQYLAWSNFDTHYIEDSELCLHMDHRFSFSDGHYTLFNHIFREANASLDDFTSRPYKKIKDVYFLPNNRQILSARNHGAQVAVYLPLVENVLYHTGTVHVLFHEFMHQWFGWTVLPLSNMDFSYSSGMHALTEGLTDFYALKFVYERKESNKEGYQQFLFSLMKESLQEAYALVHGPGHEENLTLPMHMLASTVATVWKNHSGNVR